MGQQEVYNIFKKVKGKEYTSDDFVELLNVRRSSINESIRKLSKLYNIKIRKVRINKTGMPRYYYSLM